MTDKRVQLDILAHDKTAQAWRSLQGNMERSTRIVGLLRSAVAGLATGAVVGGLKRLVDESLQVADATAKAADRAGVTTTAFQELRYAAGLAGVSTQDLETQLAKLNGRIGSAAAGGNNPFKQLGIDVRDASGAARDASSVLDDLADRYVNAGSEAGKAAILTAAFGEEGRKLAPLMKNGADGIRQAREEAERLGLVIDEKLLRQAEAFNDQMSTFGQVIRTNFQGGILQGFLGNMQDLRSVFSDPAFTEGIKTAGIALGSLAALMIRNSREIIAGSLGIATAFLTLQTASAAFGKAGGAGLAAATIAGLATSIGTYIALGERASDPTQQLVADVTSLRNAYGGLGGAIDLSNKKMAETPLDKIAKATNDLRFEADLLTSGLNETGIALRKMQKEAGLDPNKIAPPEIRAALEQYAAAYGKLSSEQKRVADAEEAKKAWVDPTKTAFAELQRAGEQAFDRIGSALTEAFTTGQIEMAKIADVGKAVVSELLQEFARLAVVNPLKNLMTGAQPGQSGWLPTLANVGAALFGPSGGGSSAQTYSDGTVIAWNAAPRAMGGPVTAGVPYVVGEKRPELFIPDRNGTILPNVPGGGPAVVNNVRVVAPPGAQVEQQERQNGSGGVDLEVVIGSAAARQMTRPGSAAQKAVSETYGLRRRAVQT